MYEPTSGAIFLDDLPLARMPADEWRACLAGAFQDFFRFEFVARHTIGLGDVARIDEQVPFDSTEIWRITSMDDGAIHPMHVHGLQFQVLSRSGPSLPTDRGWKDTVAIFPMETVDLAVRFRDHRGPE